MSKLGARVSFLAASVTLLAAPGIARADAVPPPPTDCPRGQVGITSHSGPQCVEEAPPDCPTGWRGRLGGTCALTPCETDANCQPGEACVEHSVCLQPFEDPFYDYGEEEREKHGWADPHPSDLLRSPGLLAGPPMPRTRRPVPIIRYDAVNLCSPEVGCAAPNTCQPEKLCVPREKRALAYRGKNISPVRVARKTATPLVASAAEPTEAPSPTTSATHPGTTTCAGCTEATSPITSTTRPGATGCAGCSVPSQAFDGALALASALIALLALKRRRE